MQAPPDTPRSQPSAAEPPASPLSEQYSQVTRQLMEAMETAARQADTEQQLAALKEKVRTLNEMAVLHSALHMSGRRLVPVLAVTRWFVCLGVLSNVCKMYKRYIILIVSQSPKYFKRAFAEFDHF